MWGHFLSTFSLYVPLFPIFFFWYFKPAKEWKQIRILFLIQLPIDLFFDMLNLMLARNGIYNLHVHQMYTLVLIVFLLILFRKLLAPANRKKIISVLLVIAFLIQLVNLIRDPYLQNTWISPYTFVIGLGLLGCIFHFYEIQENTITKNLLTYPPFLISGALMMYFGFSFFINLFETTIITLPSNVSQPLWLIHNVSVIIFNFLLIRVAWSMQK